MNLLLLLVLRIVGSLAFAGAGIAKLLRVKPLVEQFHDFHLPLEIMYLIGVLEVVGAVALWYPPLTFWAFAGLGCLMLGAIKSHILAKHPWKSLLPALALLAVCLGGACLDYWLHH